MCVCGGGHKCVLMIVSVVGWLGVCEGGRQAGGVAYRRRHSHTHTCNRGSTGGGIKRGGLANEGLETCQGQRQGGKDRQHCSDLTPLLPTLNPKPKQPPSPPPTPTPSPCISCCAYPADCLLACCDALALDMPTALGPHLVLKQDALCGQGVGRRFIGRAGRVGRRGRGVVRSIKQAYE